MLLSFATKVFSNKLNTTVITQLRGVKNLPKPRKRNPFWFVRQKRTIHEDYLTNENKQFISEALNDRFGVPALVKGVYTFPNSVDGNLVGIKDSVQKIEWNKFERRCGLIARKIGVVPMWRKDGSKIMTTMLQVDDNHVIKYIEPSDFKPATTPRVRNVKKFGCLLVGADSAEPSLFTKEYCGLFKESGVMPKRHLRRFLISPNARLLPGTPLDVTHFRVGDFVDVRGKTMDRGFQGVMKRWGFKGMPATHGVTKTHRRPGNIGSGGTKARVRPGQKMPGHMGNRYIKLKGLEIVRINTEYNVLWVTGHNIPGELNNIVYIFDTMLPLKRPAIKPPFPTCFEEIKEVDMWAEKYHNFKSPTVFYEED